MCATYKKNKLLVWKVMVVTQFPPSSTSSTSHALHQPEHVECENVLHQQWLSSRTIYCSSLCSAAAFEVCLLYSVCACVPACASSDELGALTEKLNCIKKSHCSMGKGFHRHVYDFVNLAYHLL